jgi:hypothetical protein
MYWGAAAHEKNGSTTSKKDRDIRKVPPQTLEEKTKPKTHVTPKNRSFPASPLKI